MSIKVAGAAIKSAKVAGVDAKSVRLGTGSTNVEVWSAMKWPVGLMVGSYEYYQWYIPSGTWGSLSSGASAPYPHPSYPYTTLEGNGIRVPAGTYSLSLGMWPIESGSYTAGMRATLNGSVISGTQFVYSGGGQIERSVTVTVSEGVLSVQCRADQFYVLAGPRGNGAPYTYLAVAPPA